MHRVENYSIHLTRLDYIGLHYITKGGKTEFCPIKDNVIKC